MGDWSIQADFHGHFELVDFVNLAIGLEAVSDHLKGDRIAERDHVDGGFSVLVGFELEGALIFVALDGVKDDMSVGNGLAVVGADDGDTNRGGKRRGFVFTAMMRVVVLCAENETAGDKGKRGESDAGRKNRTAKHAPYCKWAIDSGVAMLAVRAGPTE